ncbi:MAG: hypothetical protein K0S20_543, partial [Patescibacteria group bacterium]|nr:hypothetical protein [Patescibacteria group bacterium]
KENFIMHNIHKPREVTSVILNLKDHIGADASSPKRSPQDGVIAVINNKTIKDFGELERIGAMAPGQSTLNKIQ